jgi:hypothetical protein
MKNKNTVEEKWIQKMSNGPVWYDIDMYKAGLVGLFVGIIVGILFRG